MAATIVKIAAEPTIIANNNDHFSALVKPDGSGATDGDGVGEIEANGIGVGDGDIAIVQSNDCE